MHTVKRSHETKYPYTANMQRTKSELYDRPMKFPIHIIARRLPGINLVVAGILLSHRFSSEFHERWDPWSEPSCLEVTRYMLQLNYLSKPHAHEPPAEWWPWQKHSLLYVSTSCIRVSVMSLRVSHILVDDNDDFHFFCFFSLFFFFFVRGGWDLGGDTRAALWRPNYAHNNSR